MTKKDWQFLAGKIEALLFLSTDPMPLDAIVTATKEQDNDVLKALDYLKKRFEESNSAIELREMASGYQLFTRSEYQEFLEEYISSNDRRKLSSASLETLAIVAYCQPVTRSQVSEIRGANSDGLISGLANKGYVAEVGITEDNSATLFGTTNAFLDSLGLLDISELPDLEEFAPDAEARMAVAERLGAISKKNASPNL